MMKNQLLSSAVKAVVIVTGVIVICFVIFIPPRFVLLHVTTPSNDTSNKVRVLVKNMIWPGKHPPSLGNFYFFVIAGSGSVLVWGSGYETAEIALGSTGEIFRGNISHHSLATIFHSAHIALVAKDVNLKIERYEGFLTVEGTKIREVLAIHPEYHSVHMPLKWLLRDFTNKGRDISTLPYIMLTAIRDNKKKDVRYALDFSHAHGGVQEYTPPLDWPTGNCYSRLLYSLNGEAPAEGYTKILPLPRKQSSTPYKMGEIPFYCMINGHYCAGIVGIHSPTYIKVWVNKKKNDKTLRNID